MHLHPKWCLSMLAAAVVLSACGSPPSDEPGQGQPRTEAPVPTASDEGEDPDPGIPCDTCDDEGGGGGGGTIQTKYSAYFTAKLTSLTAVDPAEWFADDEIRIYGGNYWDVSARLFWPDVSTLNPNCVGNINSQLMHPRYGTIQISSTNHRRDLPDTSIDYCYTDISTITYKSTNAIGPTHYVGGLQIKEVQPYNPLYPWLHDPGRDIGTIYLPAWVGNHSFRVSGLEGAVYDATYTVSFVECVPVTQPCPTYFGP